MKHFRIGTCNSHAFFLTPEGAPFFSMGLENLQGHTNSHEPTAHHVHSTCFSPLIPGFHAKPVSSRIVEHHFRVILAPLRQGSALGVSPEFCAG